MERLEDRLLFVVSATPGLPDLLAATDTGASSTDDLTNRDNSAASRNLQFSIPQTVSGATVTVFADGTAIGSAVASGANTTVTTNGTVDLADGARSITAKQTEPGKTESAASSALPVTIDTVRPSGTVGPLANVNAPGASAYDFTVQYADGIGIDIASLGNTDVRVTEPVAFSQTATLLSVSPSGNGSPRTATYRLTPPGGSWDWPDNATYTVTLLASQVADTAGNLSVSATLGTFTAAMPIPLSAPDLVQGSDTGRSDTDNVTRRNNASAGATLTFSVDNTTPGAAVTLYADGVAIGAATASGTTTTITTNGAAALADGLHTFTATEVAPGGAPSAPPSPSSVVRIDTVAPSAPSTPVVRASSDSGVSDADGITNDNTPTYLVTASEADTLRLLRNGTPGPGYRLTGAGTYAVEVNSAAPTSYSIRPSQTVPGNIPEELVVEDFNGDTFPDMLTSSSSGLVVLLGNGDGTLQASNVTATPGGEPRGFSVGDFDADGKLDVVDGAPTAVGGAYLYRGNGNGTFQPPLNFAAPAAVFYTVAGDFNFDGRLDFVGGQTTGVHTFLNDGAGGFVLSNTTTATGFHSPVSTDLNGDGKADLVYGVRNEPQIGVLLGNGDGSFKPAFFANTGGDDARDLDTADLNGDGHVDVAVVTSSTSSLAVLLGNGDGTFRTPVAVPAANQPQGVVIDDLNFDGKLDLATAGLSPAKLVIALGNGDGTFQPAKVTDHGAAPSQFAAGDFNLDGRTDFAIVNHLFSGVAAVSLATGGGTTPDGDYAVSARLEDLAGNVADSATSASVTIDTVKPAAPPRPDLQAASDTGASSTDNVTADSTPSLDVVGAPYYRLTRNGVQVTGDYAGDAPYTSPTLADGQYAFQAVAVDAAGNASTAGPTLNMAVDATGPTADVVDVSPDPRTGGVDFVEIRFNESVFNVALSDFTLRRTSDPGGGSGNLLTAGQTLTAVNASTYRIENLAGITDALGSYTLSITPDAGHVIRDTAGNALPLTTDVSDSWVVDGTAPAVAAVFVSSSSWLETFRNAAATAGLGDSTFGVAISAAAQTDELPWTTLNRISIRFSENVIVAADDLVVRGVNSATYPLAASNNFSYDAVTHTATWTFASAFAVDKLLLDLDADAGTGVTDAVGNRLDGEWTNPAAPAVSGDTFPSGDGAQGGDFRFRLNVLPGDVNRSGGSVIGSDVTLVRNAQNASPGAPGSLYTVFKDVNGSGTIVGSDVTAVRNLQGRSLPAGEPAAPAPEVVSTGMLAKKAAVPLETLSRKRLVDGLV